MAKNTGQRFYNMYNDEGDNQDSRGGGDAVNIVSNTWVAVYQHSRQVEHKLSLETEGNVTGGR